MDIYRLFLIFCFTNKAAVNSLIYTVFLMNANVSVGNMLRSGDHKI